MTAAGAPLECKARLVWPRVRVERNTDSAQAGRTPVNVALATASFASFPPARLVVPMFSSSFLMACILQTLQLSERRSIPYCP